MFTSERCVFILPYNADQEDKIAVDSIVHRLLMILVKVRNCQLQYKKYYCTMCIP